MSVPWRQTQGTNRPHLHLPFSDGVVEVASRQTYPSRGPKATGALRRSSRRNAWQHVAGYVLHLSHAMDHDHVGLDPLELAARVSRAADDPRIADRTDRDGITTSTLELSSGPTVMACGDDFDHDEASRRTSTAMRDHAAQFLTQASRRGPSAQRVGTTRRPRARRRRSASSSSTSSQDPGGSGEPEPAASARPALYSYAVLDATARGADSEPVR